MAELFLISRAIDALVVRAVSIIHKLNIVIVSNDVFGLRTLARLDFLGSLISSFSEDTSQFILLLGLCSNGHSL